MRPAEKINFLDPLFIGVNGKELGRVAKVTGNSLLTIKHSFQM